MDIDRLRACLAAWASADDDERADVAALLTVLAPESGSRAHFAPGHVTASGLVFSVDGSRLALVWHAGFGRWIQPGGHLEPDEEPVAAALRELEEEIGATDLQPLGPVDVSAYDVPANPGKGEPAHRHFDLRYAFRVDGPLLRRPGVRWVLLDEVTAEDADDGVVRGLRRWRSR